LVRKICGKCKEEYKCADELLDRVDRAGMEFTGGSLYRGRGCEDCLDTGFKGRVGIYELLIIDRAVQDLIIKKAQSADIEHYAIEKGMTTLYADGMRKVSEGVTTVEEVLRITQKTQV